MTVDLPMPEAFLAAPENALLGKSPDGMLARRIGRYAALSPEETMALEAILDRDVRKLRNRAVLVEEGIAPGEMIVLLEGWVCRYTRTGDGRRRVVAFHVPGDVCGFDMFMPTTVDQSVAATGPVRVAGIDRAAFDEISCTHPRIGQIFWQDSLAAAAIQRAWTINVGHRGAKQRIAHLLCELHARLSFVGLVEEDGFALPLTQSDIGDACGMTAIHTNRTLQELRSADLITLQSGRLAIHDVGALTGIADFDPSYLQSARSAFAVEKQLADGA